MKVLFFSKKKKQPEIGIKDAIRLLEQLKEKQQDLEEMERALGHHVQADAHKYKRHGLHDYQLQLEKMLEKGKKISA